MFTIALGFQLVKYYYCASTMVEVTIVDTVRDRERDDGKSITKKGRHSRRKVSSTLLMFLHIKDNCC